MSHDTSEKEHANDNHDNLGLIDRLIRDCIRDKDEMKSTRIGLFEEMIRTKIIDVDDALPILIKRMRTVADMGMVIVCLRNGADCNLYVNAESLGPAHILVYAYNTFYNNSTSFKTNKSDSSKTNQSYDQKVLFEMFYIIMVMSGSVTSSPAYKTVKKEDPLDFYQKKGNTTKKNVIFDESIIKIESTYSWLSHKENFNLPGFTTELIDLVSKKPDRNIYGVYLNTDRFGKWKETDIQYMLTSRNSNWQNIDLSEPINKNKANTKNKDLLKQNSIYLNIAIGATFFDLVVAQLNQGMRPTYVDFSFWVQHYKRIKEVHNVEYLINQLELSFIELIRRGYKIDLYYLDEIGSINPDLRRTLYDEYEKPLYEKVCSIKTDNFIPDEIKNVSVYLGIPESSSKFSFCSSIESITQADHESLIHANKKRSTDAISTKLNLLSDFINHNHFDGCTNISSFEENPLNYPIDLLAYYKDNEGQTWCFLSNDFDGLLRNKVNPSTKDKLPEDFIARLEQQRDILEYFNIPLSDPKTINRIISDIKKTDIPSNEETDKIINRIKLVLEPKGYTEDFIIKKMKLGDIVRKFENISVDIREILILSSSEYSKTIEKAKTELSPRIIYNLICFTLNDVLSESVEQLKNFLR